MGIFNPLTPTQEIECEVQLSRHQCETECDRYEERAKQSQQIPQKSILIMNQAEPALEKMAAPERAAGSHVVELRNLSFRRQEGFGRRFSVC